VFYCTSAIASSAIGNISDLHMVPLLKTMFLFSYYIFCNLLSNSVNGSSQAHSSLIWHSLPELRYIDPRMSDDSDDRTHNYIHIDTVHVI
jgi:hypothetical protein